MSVDRVETAADRDSARTYYRIHGGADVLTVVFSAQVAEEASRNGCRVSAVTDVDREEVPPNEKTRGDD